MNATKPTKLETTFADPGIVDSIDDASEVYGDHDDDEFPEIDTPCELSPSGQCEYASSDYDTCIHCGRKT